MTDPQNHTGYGDTDYREAEMGEREIVPCVGDTIRVELNSGDEMTGPFEYHSLAGDCILNQFGFPVQYKRVLEVIDYA